MPRQRAIRFPDDLHDAIEAEAKRRGHPWTFSSLITDGMRRLYGIEEKSGIEMPIERALEAKPPDVATSAVAAGSDGPSQGTAVALSASPRTSVQRGSPSPSLERFAKPETKR